MPIGETSNEHFHKANKQFYHITCKYEKKLIEIKNIKMDQIIILEIANAMEYFNRFCARLIRLIRTQNTNNIRRNTNNARNVRNQHFRQNERRSTRNHRRARNEVTRQNNMCRQQCSGRQA